MNDQGTAEKAYLTEAWVGSEAWVHAVQESILDNRSLCFFCGDPISYKLDFFYMRGRMGTLMLHEGCFTPFGRGKKVALARHRNVAPNGVGDLPPGEWFSLADAAEYMGITYNALYQRVWSSGGFKGEGFEKRLNQWFISRATVESMGKGKRGPGRPRKVAKSRIWRSDVTESVDRISSTEAAKLIGVSRSWVLTRKDRFDAIKVEGEWRLSRKLVEDYIRIEEQSETEPVS